MISSRKSKNWSCGQEIEEVNEMFRYLFAVGLALAIGISLSASVFGDPWYYENFDELDDGSLTPQDGWRNGGTTPPLCPKHPLKRSPGV